MARYEAVSASLTAVVLEWVVTCTPFDVGSWVSTRV